MKPVCCVENTSDSRLELLPLFNNYVTSASHLDLLRFVCLHGNNLAYSKALTHSSVQSREVTPTDPHVVTGTVGHLVALTATTMLAVSEPSRIWKITKDM